MSDTAQLAKDAMIAIAGARTDAELEAIAVEYLGRKNGRISSLLSGIGQIAPADRAALGMAANDAKRAIEAGIATRRAELEGARLADIAERTPVTLTLKQGVAITTILEPTTAAGG